VKQIAVGHLPAEDDYLLTQVISRGCRKPLPKQVNPNYFIAKPLCDAGK